MKILPLLITLMLSNPVLANDEVKNFLELHPRGLELPGTAAGGKSWSQLREFFKKTGDARLLKISYLSPSGVGNQAAEKAIAFYDMFMARPIEFIKGVPEAEKNVNCIFKILIPQTQYIPFEDLSEKLKSLNSKDPKILEFEKMANKYYEGMMSSKADKTTQC